ncbi:MAG: hypothetical protein CFE44_19590 [Burkholderiales bacterium PBB4]|nr:MAG: hypothetical protein CFE44_19590 [Burkholderiales bacterium PBB4]
MVRGDDDSVDSHRQFYDEYNAVLDMPAEYYLETIKKVFQEFALVNGTWEKDGTLVRPQDITTSALLTVEGELDDISGSGQTRAAHDLCTGIPKNRQFHYDVEGAGHYGIFSGRRWRDLVYPQVKAFISAHQPVVAKVTPVAPTPKPVVTARPAAARKPVVAKKSAQPATSKAAVTELKSASSQAPNIASKSPSETVVSAGAAPKKLASKRKPAAK